MTPTELITKVLSIVGYEGDIELCTERYLRYIYTYTFTNLIGGLPAEQQSSILEKLEKAKTDSVKINELLGSYFAQDQINVQVEESSRQITEGLLLDILPSLSEKQKLDLTTYLLSTHKSK